MTTKNRQDQTDANDTEISREQRKRNEKGTKEKGEVRSWVEGKTGGKEAGQGGRRGWGGHEGRTIDKAPARNEKRKWETGGGTGKGERKKTGEIEKISRGKKSKRKDERRNKKRANVDKNPVVKPNHQWQQAGGKQGNYKRRKKMQGGKKEAKGEKPTKRENSTRVQ